MLSGWLGGFGPGMCTTGLSVVIAAYFWVPPARSLWITAPQEWFGLMMFIAIGFVISVLNEAWRRRSVALAESEQRLAVTLASIGDAVMTTDEDGRVTSMNEVAEKLTGWAAPEALGRMLEDVFVIVDERSREPTPNPARRALRDGVVTELAPDTLLVSRDGRTTPIEDSAAPIRVDHGRAAGVVMVFRDVTERRRT